MWSLSNNHQPPKCPVHLVPQELRFYGRPGGPPGNSWVCPRCADERLTAHEAEALRQIGVLKSLAKPAEPKFAAHVHPDMPIGQVVALLTGGLAIDVTLPDGSVKKLALVDTDEQNLYLRKKGEGTLRASIDTAINRK